MKEVGLTEDKAKHGNMALIFGMAVFYAFQIVIILQFLEIHQVGAFSIIGGHVDTAKPSYLAFMADYGTAYRTFKHGMLHGFLAGLFFAFPFIGNNSLF